MATKDSRNAYDSTWTMRAYRQTLQLRKRYAEHLKPLSNAAESITTLLTGTSEVEVDNLDQEDPEKLLESNTEANQYEQ